MLLASGLPNAACGALRAQYEVVLRAAWLLYCARPDEVNRLLQPLNLKTEQQSNNVLGTLKMLAGLQVRLKDDPGSKGELPWQTQA